MKSLINMFKASKMFKFAIGVTMSMLITACTENTGEEKKYSSGKSTGASAARAAIGKPGAPVTIDFEVPRDIIVGNLIDVNLTFRSTTPAGRLTVNLNTSDGLTLLSEARQYFDLAASTMTAVVRLQTERDGLYYLHVIVAETDANENPLLGRSFAVPIQIGDAPPEMKTSGEVLEQGEEKITEMISK